MTADNKTSNTGAEFIADSVQGLGIDHVFFVDAVLRETLVALEKRGIKRILAHSEKSAAYMADGFARATGKLGVCMAQSVGAANLAAGLQDAYLNRTPVLAITGKKDAMHQYRNSYQEVPHAPLYESVTKYQADVDEIDQLPYLLKQAVRSAFTGTKRPVHLDFMHYRGSDIEDATLQLPAGVYAQFVTPDAADQAPASEASLAAAMSRLVAAERPMMVVGMGADEAGIADALRQFAEKFDVPIATSVGGRSLIETSHPLHFGVVGTYSAPYANEMLFDADLVIYVGCHTGDQISCDWKIPATATPIIHIDIDPAELGRNYPNTCGLAGHPVKVLEQLVAAGEAQSRAAWTAKCAKAQSDWVASYQDIITSPQQPIRAERLAYDLSDALPDDAIVVADTGFSATWTAQLTEFRKPTQQYIRAAGSLGWAFPAAVGVKCGQMNRPVICFTGDGAMHYHSSELETVRRWNIPLITIVNNNSSLGQGLRSVKQLYKDRDGNLDDLVNFHPINFAELAEVYGIKGMRVERAEDIVPTIKKAIELGEPVVIDVVTDADCNPQPAWIPA
ncbi:thiamine pyrophosphate-binding protein [Marinovum sp. 2_MG-2023]|uniref:thiamine pyrophosphate-binding protein n=1 Tax=unclassified Marinovum TaxID=2647166 RepID=UPI0026E363FF|nr:MULTISPECIES: thiamine pyrophosphate-binding protein [unclassified Marinovum]MDO6729968.1 thiamine pyrophosphate-binding protein [Marinovum sp. 2_MG-2023]MDO6779782.1 thiamine pyrophosphate-binding protein [Marinovum sp. 1_MG-2023]